MPFIQCSISCDLGGRALRCSSCQNCLRRMTRFCGSNQTSLEHSMTREMSLSALWGRSSRSCWSEPSKNVTSFRVAEVYTIPRLRRLLQMGAAIGWLQRSSSCSSEGRVLGPRSGWLQRAAAQWLSADSGARWCFPADAGRTTCSR